ncbi:MAG: RNA polymerase sigma factor [Granulosicoccus sp.]
MQTVLTEAQLTRVKTIVLPPASLSDEQIIKRIQGGDIDAYGGILRRYNQRMFRIARSIVTDDAGAKDVVQEAHIKAYTRLGDFRGPAGFRTWLATITRNEALMYLRKNKRREVSFDEPDTHEDDFADNSSERRTDQPDTCLENCQLQALINQQIDKLPDDFRVVFVLRAIEQFSVRETAQVLDIRLETVKTRYFRARRLLRGQIQACLDEAGLQLYEFGGLQCDNIVHHVMAAIRQIR